MIKYRPIAIGGQSVLAAANLCVQGHANVELPTGQSKPISNFLITVASSGERKTACDDIALYPIRLREKSLYLQHQDEFPLYANDKAAWDKARDEALKKSKGDRAAAKAALDMIGLPPPRPLEPMLTCQEPTFQGLTLLYGIGHPSLGIFANEGGQFIGGHGMNSENKLMMATGLSMLWDGDPIRRVRKGDGISTLFGRRLSIHLMVQPDVGSIMFTDRILEDQGLLSRTLISAPDTLAGKRFWKESSSESHDALVYYNNRLHEILQAPLPLAESTRNELTPRLLPLSKEAKNIWIAFANHVESSIAPNGELEPIRGLANKLPEHAARLAATLTLVEKLDALCISSEQMAAGIKLAQHYATEALRLYGASRANTDIILCQKLLNWLQQTWKEPNISLPNIYQRNPLTAIRDAAKARKLVDMLVEHGYLQRIPGGAEILGEKRRDAWRIVKEV